MTNARILFVGGGISFRALFNWLNPWIFVPVLLVVPVLEIVFFAYVGRAAELESDEFYVIGGALLATAVPCLFAMSNTLTGERRYQTLQYLLSTPANRLSLYFGRALPVIANGFVVAAFSLVGGALLFGVRMSTGSWTLLVACLLVASFSATGLGLICGAFGLRGRDTTVLANVLCVLLLLFCGANVPLGTLPGWMQGVAQVIPLTHAIEAARKAADGASLGAVSGLLLAELGIGVVYAAVGIWMLHGFETTARKHATIDLI